jgi:hypothetical protein
VGVGAPTIDVGSPWTSEKEFPDMRHLCLLLIGLALATCGSGCASHRGCANPCGHPGQCGDCGGCQMCGTACSCAGGGCASGYCGSDGCYSGRTGLLPRGGAACDDCPRRGLFECLWNRRHGGHGGHGGHAAAACQGCGGRGCHLCGGRGHGGHGGPGGPGGAYGDPNGNPYADPYAGQMQAAPGPGAGAVAYPYYTTRGPRDFLINNPPSIGPY